MAFDPRTKNSSPSTVAQPTAEIDPLAEYAIGDLLGGFTGYLRRAQPAQGGLVCQIFGENGADADMITTLHLSKFLEAQVAVTIWWVKDATGRIKSENGKWPKLAEFSCRIRRPKSSNMGLVAQFFGTDGTHADAINQLNVTRYLDALVHVEIRKADPGQVAALDSQIEEPAQAIAQAASRLVPAEAKALKLRQKKAADAHRILLQKGFFRSEATWSALGTPFVFQDWLKQQACIHPMDDGDSCDGSPVVPFAIPGQKVWRFVPLCRAHAHEWAHGAPDLGGRDPMGFLLARHTNLIQRWAQVRLRDVLGVQPGYDPTPSAIYEWAAQAKIKASVPTEVLALI